MSSEVLRSCARLVASCTSRSQVLSHHGLFPSASSNHAQRLLFSANVSVAVPSLIHASSWAAWGSRTWSSQSSQPSGNEKKKKSQKTEANANVPSASNPTTQETAHAAPASAPMPASQPSGVMMQERETIQQIRARIFGEPILPGERTGRRVLARPLKGAELARWYFMPPFVPGMHNEEKEYVMLRKKNKRQKRTKDADDGAVAGKKKKK